MRLLKLNRIFHCQCIKASISTWGGISKIDHKRSKISVCVAPVSPASILKMNR